MSPALGPRPCSVDALCSLSDTQSVRYPDRHTQAFQKPPEGGSIPSSDFIARFLASAVWGRGQGRCVLIRGLLLHPRPPSSSHSPRLCTRVSLCHWQFYPEPRVLGLLSSGSRLWSVWTDGMLGGQPEKPSTSLLDLVSPG